MEVFVLMLRFDSEGDMLLGVYASEEEAVDALGVYNRDLTAYLSESYFISRQVIGAPADAVFTADIQL